MTRRQAYNSLTQGVRKPRFRLKPNGDCSGYVDGAWWPRTDDLTAELPDLLGVLSFRRRAVDHVAYNFSEWATRPVEITIGGSAVQLDGYRGQPPNTVEVLDAQGNKTVLLVVPSHTDPDQAHSIVMAAAASGNMLSVDALLMISVKYRDSRRKRDAARERMRFVRGSRFPTRPGRAPSAGRTINQGQNNYEK
jgi:Family of unknown function (DUF5994)